VPHLFGATAFQEASWPTAAVVWAAERPLPWAYRRAGFHAISESTRDDLVARGIAPSRVRVIHPGVDGTRFTPAPDGRRAPAPSFLYVGRLKRYKGIGVAIRALALARGKRPDLSLDIAGSGDYRPALERLTSELGLEDAVRFHGYVSEAEKITLLRRAWANVFPSPKEGWGITVIEAAACGTPSIASDSPGLRDSVRHGETGFLVPHGDVESLAGRMLELAAAPALVAALGARARRFAEELTWERTAADTERHLHDIIAGSGGARAEGFAMQTTITARHCEIPDALRERARTVVQRLGGLTRRPIESAVVFDTDGGRSTAELRLYVARTSCRRGR
jgi:glycosyltransferase involved in cell wall biosynthesis